MENIYRQRIGNLRILMREKGWDAVILTGSDPHNSECPAERWKQVQWLTGFTGEAGDVVVTMDHAGLWTDTRYFIQATEQLAGTGVELHRMRVPEQVPIPEWLASHFEDAPGVVIAVDGLCVPASFVTGEISTAMAARRIEFCVQSAPDFLSTMWESRPGIPQTPVFTVDPGEDMADRMCFLREAVAGSGCDGILLSSLDEIAWVLNVRASDIEYNPLVISYLYVDESDAFWFVVKESVEDEGTAGTFAALENRGVRIKRYDEVAGYLSGLGKTRIFVDEANINYELFSILSSSDVALVPGKSPVALRKAVKSPFETEGLRKAMLSDGVVMEQFLYWLEKSLASDKIITEWDAAVKLGKLRAGQDGYLGDSFGTISAYGRGAALPHYVTPCIDAPVIGQGGLYLCDSGGQYYSEGGPSGTTDITRTVPTGECSELEAEDYTLVLKGHIDLAMAVFPEGTPGCRIDALAREPLWKFRRTFGHGTGHGVGWFLGCHEGPQDVRQNLNPQPLLPGMVISDEPGIYREGFHGVRHENLLLCVEDESNDFGRWLRFEPLTLCHFDTSVIVPELLGTDEIAWLNEYNARVYRTLSPLLPEEVAAWLEKKTRPIRS